MHIPSLFNNANPGAPRWAVPLLDPTETRDVSESVIMIVCPHPRTRAIAQWGSGVIVAAMDDSMWVVSAAHLFTDWIAINEHDLRAADTSPSAPFDARRLTHYIDEDIFRVVVNLDYPVGRRVCKVDAISLPKDPAEADVALLRVRYPPGAGSSQVSALPLDFEAFPNWAPVVIAGYSGAEAHAGHDDHRWQGYGEASTRDLYCRVGHVAEWAERSSGMQAPMYGISIPSLQGMSGGPVILDRNFIDEVVRIIPRPSRFPLAVVGIVSRDGSHAELPDSCRDGETWASPIAQALDLSVEEGWTLRQAIVRGRIRAYGSASVSRES
jgi:hypothetical protein